MRSAYEWYFRGRINFKRPTLEIFMNRYNLFRMVLTMDHIKDFLYDVLYKAVNHERDGDKRRSCTCLQLRKRLLLCFPF
eukprot:UN07514